MSECSKNTIAMNFFNLVKKGSKSGQSSRAPRNHRRSKGQPEIKLSSSFESTDVESSDERETWVEAKLIKAKERRDEVDRIREDAVNLKAEQALRRAEQSLQDKKDKLQKRLNRIDAVKERRMVIEEERCIFIESRLHNAMKRADQVVKRRQIRARRDERMNRVKNRRALNEFEKRSALLSNIDKRLDRAAKNLQLMIYDRQTKARGEVEQAKLKARKVKAVKIIQREVRFRFGFSQVSDRRVNLSQNVAVRRLQEWKQLRQQVVANRLSNLEDLPDMSGRPLAYILSSMGCQSASSNSKKSSFVQVSSALGHPLVLEAARRVLKCFDPVLSNETVCERTFLSAFLIAYHPSEVLGNEFSSDKCSSQLVKMSHRLISFLSQVSNSAATGQTVKDITCTLLSYSTLFDVWKNKDLQDLIDNMMLSAEQSWIIFITSKEAIAYCEEKSSQDSSANGTLYQFQLRYESSYKGAGAHIKRIRASLNKLLGSKEGLSVMKKARQTALRKIRDDKLVPAIKTEADLLMNPESLSSEEANDGTSDAPMDDEVPEDLSSNIELVHKILLTDQEDDEEILSKTPGSMQILHDIADFMDQWHQTKAVKSGETQCDINSIQEVIAQTMEKAFFNKIEEDLMVGNMNGIKQLLSDLYQKMKNLVPNRSDLHSHFKQDEIVSCRSTADVIRLLIKAADALGNALESEHRSHSTLQWKQDAMTHMKRKKSIPYKFKTLEAFAVASVAFLLTKAEMCHLDLVKFQMIQVSPMIRRNGKQYELANFQKMHGTLDSMTSIKQLTGTWEWMNRCIKDDMTPTDLKSTLKTDGFVDELIFLNERFAIPEVLALDLGSIKAIRACAKGAVISSALFLHSANICGISSSQLRCESLSSKANHFREKTISLLLNGGSIGSEKLKTEISEAICSFARAITAGDSNGSLQPGQISSLLNCTTSVLDGHDAVLNLLESRMKKLFKSIIMIDIDKKHVPDAMQTGIASKTKLHSNPKKQKFMKQAIKEASKLGFSLVSSEIAETAYDAHKIISHCTNVYTENVFVPMMNEMSLRSSP